MTKVHRKRPVKNCRPDSNRFPANPIVTSRKSSRVFGRCVQRFLTGGVSVCCLIVGSFTTTQTVRAQDAANVFLPAPRALRQHLTRAERALVEERYGEAVVQLGALLSDSRLAGADLAQLNQREPQDYFVETTGAMGARTSLKSEAQRLLGLMPPRARELYELQFGGDARALLDAAVHHADMEKLYEVVRKYFHTEAGYEAMVLLGRLHMDRGRPLAAALCFQRVLEAPVAVKKYDPELSILLAACWLYARRHDEARQAVAQLRQRFPRARLTIGDEETGSLPAANQELQWLARYFGSGRAGDDNRPREWRLFRGNLSRTAQNSGSLPLTNFRWQAPTATDPADERLVEEIHSSYLNQSIAALPGLHPLAVNNMIVMRTPEKVLGIDFRTGKRVWEYPWGFDNGFTTASVTASRRGPVNTDVEKRKEKLIQRLWYDAPYGQMSSDGEAVYFLHDLRYAQFGRSDPRWFPQRGRGRQPNPDWPQSHNELVALSLNREGALNWRVGGVTGWEEPELAGAFFLGAPLPLMGQLFVLAELNGEIRLVALDAQTGRQQWSQQLAHVDTVTILRNRTRRLAGATPSYSDGVLVCPTSAGAIVAVDLSTRTLMWGNQYEPLPRPSRFGFPPAYQRRSTNPADRWVDATVTVAGDTVLLTPVESNKLYCLDLLTGEPKWNPLQRKGDLSEMQYLAGVHDGNAVFVGKHKVVAISLRDGSFAWPAPIELDRNRGEMPSGRGFQSGRYYYLPATSAQLLKLDLAQGVVTQRQKTGEILGNLISYRDEMISQSPARLATFFQIEPLRATVAERLADSPDDAWALARQGELLIHDGDAGRALAALQRAHSLAPDDQAVRSLLVETFLTALREDFTSHRAIAAELEPLIDRPQQRSEYLRLMAVGLHEIAPSLEAARAYVELAELSLATGSPASAVEPRLVQVDEDLTTRLDRWLLGRISQLYAVADTEVQSELTEIIRTHLTRALEGPIVQLEQFLSVYGFHSLADAARAELAGRYLEKGRHLELSVLYSDMVVHSPPEQLAPLTAYLASQLAEQKQFAESAVYYRRLQQHYADMECEAGRTGSQLYSAALEQVPLQLALAPASLWPYGRPDVSHVAGAPDRSFRRVAPIPVVAYTGVGPRDLTVTYDSIGASAIVVRNDWGQTRLQLTLLDSRVHRQTEHGMSYAHVCGNLMLIVLGDKVLAVDLSRAGRNDDDAVLWREAFTQSVSAIASRPGPRGDRPLNNPFEPTRNKTFYVKDSNGKPVGRLGLVTGRGVCYLRSRTLMCVDPVSGELLWKRTNLARGSDVFGDDQYVFVVAPTSNEALVLHAVDGRLAGRRRLPDLPHRWATSGRRVLAWERLEQGTRLFLLDVWGQAEIWSDDFAPDSRGRLVGTDQVAVMQPDGRFLVRSLRHQNAIVEAHLEPESQLSEIHVLRSQQQLLLVTDRNVTTNPLHKPVSGGLPAPLVQGQLYAFDARSGQPAWQTPAEIEDFGLVLAQPNGLPTLWFLRQVSTRRQGRGRNDVTSVICLDRRDGRILLEEHAIPTKTNSYRISPDPIQRTIQLVLPGHTLRVRFTDEPTPPEPPGKVAGPGRRAES